MILLHLSASLAVRLPGSSPTTMNASLLEGVRSESRNP